MMAKVNIEPALKCNQPGGSGVCSSEKFCKLDFLKLPETCIFLIITISHKFLRRATKLHEREHCTPARAVLAGKIRGGMAPERKMEESGFEGDAPRKVFLTTPFLS